MRDAFVNELVHLAENDPRIWLVNGDLGYSVLEPFIDRFPDRALNSGISEQAMMGMAAGIAMSGGIVFVYSIGNFPTLRCLEQVRNDVCYTGASVKIVSVGGGFAYGHQGYTHHALEELGAMRLLPGMTVCAPADAVEARLLTRALASRSGPAYMRLSRTGEPLVHANLSSLDVGRILPVADGTDVLFLATGVMVTETLRVRSLLAERGITAAVASVHSWKPFDEDFIVLAASRYRLICTVEEHAFDGGLGERVASAMMATDRGAGLLRFAVAAEKTMKMVGGADYLRRQSGIDALSILEKVTAALGLPVI